MPVRVPLQRLEDRIVALEEAPVVTGRILFYGDSYFTRWKPEPRGFPRLESVLVGPSGEECTLNHGFGGSTAEELLYYYPRAVRPYRPSALVYKAFGNDMGFGYSAREVLELAERLFAYARADFPGIHLYLHGPVGSRKEHPAATNIRRREFEELLRWYADRHDDCTFFTIMDSPLFFDDPADMGDFDKIRADVYDEDGVHFNALGYELYGRFFKEVLADRLR